MPISKIGSAGVKDANLSADDLAPGAVTNAKLANSSMTLNGTAVSLGGSADIGTQWQAEITADGSTATTAVAGEGYFINTTSATHTINLPTSPSVGDEVDIVDSRTKFSVNNVTVGRGGSNIKGAASDETLDQDDTKVKYVYSGATRGWLPVNDERLTPSYIAASGGTESTSGDFKIHTFTSSSNFVVSTVGNTAGSNTFDYLIVSGGGAGGSDNGGGGGAGGVVYATSQPVLAQTYPVTVGAGGASAPDGDNPGRPGNNSSFNSQPVYYGGGGRTSGTTSQPGSNYANGGGGAGVVDNCGSAGAGVSGNTQSPVTGTYYGGNAGGAGREASSPTYRAGGGGGANAAGQAAPSSSPGSGHSAGDGGAGQQIDIDGNNYYWGGGGGGGSNCGPGGDGGLGGGGGGGGQNSGAASSGGGTAINSGTGAASNQVVGGNAGANTGGGGGGSSRNITAGSGLGGSGIVIVKYKYQN
jgi:hypothetical protein